MNRQRGLLVVAKSSYVIVESSLVIYRKFSKSLMTWLNFRYCQMFQVVK
jgi:hypothetical protein